MADPIGYLAGKIGPPRNRRASNNHASIHLPERTRQPMPTTPDKNPAEPDADRPRIDVADTLSRLERPWTPPTIAVDCAGCHGNGKVNMTVNDLLRESLALVEDADEFARGAYQRLFNKAPHVKTIFPPDLLTASRHDEGSKGLAQRERLVSAVVGLAEHYGRSPEEMDQLDKALRRWGTTHAAFWWPEEGRSRPPTRAEYEAVWQALAETFVATLGNRWKPEYGIAWEQAYDHAEVEMRHATQHEGQAFTAPRLRREHAR
jgi:hemoglobin-like flavoprotein